LAALTSFRKSLDSKDIGADEKVKNYISTYLKNQKLLSDIKSGSKTAKQFLMMRLFNTAGCIDDSLAGDYRGIATKEQYNILQNEIVSKISRSFMANDGEWTLAARGNHFEFSHRSNKEIKFTLSDKVSKRDNVDGASYSTNTEAKGSRELLKMFNRKASKVSEDIIEALINSQNLIIKSLMSLKESGLWTA